jgi:NADH-quinone oxidoreductase subunit M
MLSFILFWPLAGALLILVIPKEDVRTIRIIGTVFALITLGMAAVLWVNVWQAAANHVAYLPEEPRPWILAFNINYSLVADGLSTPLVFLTALLTTLALWYSTRTVPLRVKEYFALFLLLETSAFGVFLAQDLVLFYAFWVLGLFPLLLLISVWGGQKRERAAIKFFLYNLLGSVAMLVAILAVYARVGTFDVAEAAAARPYADLPGTARWVFLAFLFAFAVRLPLFPFHTWMPDAQAEAPTAGSAALAGLFLSAGGYGLIRVALPLFPAAFQHFATDVPLIPILAVISIVYGALVCMAQWDLKRLIAYLSLAQMGFVVLGACAAAVGDTASKDAATAGLNGAAMQLFAHGIVVAALFFLAGILYERARTYDLKAFGGLAAQIPHYYGLMLAAGFAALGLPGLMGFWGEYLVLRGAVHFSALIAYACIGTLGVLFTAGCILWKVVQHLFLGTLDREKWGLLADMADWEKVTLWPLVLVMVLVGFYPTPVLDTFNAALTELLGGLR